MAHLTHLSLLLVTILVVLLISGAFSQRGFNVTLQNCPGKWNMELNEKVFFLECQTNTPTSFNLKIWALPWYCFWSFTCFQIRVATFGSPTQKYDATLCKCCMWSCPTTFCTNLACNKSLNIPMAQNGISTVNVQFGGSSDLSAANSTNADIALLSVQNTSLNFYQEAKSWIEALKKCYKLNSSLVQITNQTIQNAVFSLLQDETGWEAGVWVGLERSIFGTDVEWKWTSGVKAEWNYSVSVDRLNNHCGKIIWVNESAGMKLLDANCHDELPYICQGPV